MRALLITLMCAVLPLTAEAMPRARKDVLPTNPVAGLHAATPIDFNSMIDANQARNDTLSHRLRTKNKARSLHLTRGHIRIAREKEPTRTRTNQTRQARQEASVNRPKRIRNSKGQPESVRVVLLPRPPAR